MSDFQELAEALLQEAALRGDTLETAESGTAGCLATLLADAPRAGDVLHGGFVVYSKDQKAAVLGIDPRIIAHHTAVSEAVARAMASGVLQRCPASMGIAISGGGPDPDKDGNPVGLCHVAVAYWNGKLFQRRSELGEDTRESRVCVSTVD